MKMEEVVVISSLILPNEDKFVWDRKQVLLLIKEYRKMESKFKDHSIKKKVLWRKIAQNLKRNGVDVSWELCDKKWRNLKQTFKAIYNSKRSEVSKRRWEFFKELEDIFSNDPSVRGSLSSFEDSLEILEMSDIDNYICPETDSVEDHKSNGSVIYPIVKVTDKTDIPSDQLSSILHNGYCAPVWFQGFMSQFLEEEKMKTNMIKSMFRDIVRLEERKCELLEVLMDKC